MSAHQPYQPHQVPPLSPEEIAELRASWQKVNVPAPSMLTLRLLATLESKDRGLRQLQELVGTLGESKSSLAESLKREVVALRASCLTTTPISANDQGAQDAFAAQESEIASLRSIIEAKDKEIEKLLYTSDKQTVAWKERALKAEATIEAQAAALADWKRNGHIYLVKACDRRDAKIEAQEQEIKSLKDQLDRLALATPEEISLHQEIERLKAEVARLVKSRYDLGEEWEKHSVSKDAENRTLRSALEKCREKFAEQAAWSLRHSRLVIGLARHAWEKEASDLPALSELCGEALKGGGE